MEYNPERALRPFAFQGVPWKVTLDKLVVTMENALVHFDPNSPYSAPSREAAREILGLATAFVNMAAKLERLKDLVKDNPTIDLKPEQALVVGRTKASLDLIERAVNNFRQDNEPGAKDVNLRENIVRTARSIMKDLEALRLHPYLTSRLNDLISLRPFPEKAGAHFGNNTSPHERLLLPAQTGGPYPAAAAITLPSGASQDSVRFRSMNKDYQFMIDSLRRYFEGENTSQEVLLYAQKIIDQAGLLKGFCDDKLIMPQLEQDRQNLEKAVAWAKRTIDPSLLDHRLVAVHKSAQAMYETFHRIDFSFDVYSPQIMGDAFDQAAQPPQSSMSNAIRNFGISVVLLASGWLIGRWTVSTDSHKASASSALSAPAPADALRLQPGSGPEFTQP